MVSREDCWCVRVDTDSEKERSSYLTVRVIGMNCPKEVVHGSFQVLPEILFVIMFSSSLVATQTDDCGINPHGVTI